MQINGVDAEIKPYANLREANLREANLCGANLYGANLCEANLCGANLYGADLCGANLCEANLCGADLRGANLCGANLCEANLCGADLRGANLRGAKNIPEILKIRTTILPNSGPIHGWKKCKSNVLVKVAVGSNAKRSNATGRKCRAEYVKVLDVVGAEVGVSEYDGKTTYKKGDIVRCDKWEEDRWTECGGGIHFFLTREEAEAY